MSGTKTQLLSDRFREMILSNMFPEGRLPGERELAEQFDAGRRTVRDALGIIEREGLIDRCRHTGTIVRKTPRAPEKGVAGLIMRSAGHVYADLYHDFLMEFTNNGYAVQSIATNGIDNLYGRRPSLTRAVESLLKSDPAALIVDGYCVNAIPHLDEIRKRHPVFIDFFDSGSKRFNTGVWFDYYEAGHLAGKYLAEHGCRRPIFLPNWVPPGIRLNPEAYAVHREKKLIDGFKAAMKEAGIDPELTVAAIAYDMGETSNILSDMTANLPDGFCAADVRIVEFMKLLLEHFGRIPEEIVFAGIGNTPWSGESSLIPFTSVDHNLKGLARAAAAQAELPFEQRTDILIKPQLIVRERNRTA